MIKELKLTNFRGFRAHELPFRQRMVIVGENNAGKSTIVEALKLVSLVTNRYKSLNYGAPPVDSVFPAVVGVTPSLEDITIDFRNLFHNLGDPPAVVSVTFEDGKNVELYLAEGRRVFGVVTDAQGRNVKSKREARLTDLPQINILTQVSPLARDEVVLSSQYVRDNISTDIAPLHFRNQLCLFEPAFKEFSRLAAETWPGLRIVELIGKGAPRGSPTGLLVADDNFTGDVSWMGHGLQVWLQAVWFMARTPQTATVVLDEPDVYLHPDLQRRLIRIMRSKYKQLIITTHSIEIMSEVEPSEILIVDKRVKISRFADNQPAVQKLVDHIGSAHNISLARLTATKKFLIVEGDDLDILSQLHGIMFPNSDTPLSTIPHLSLGGWGGWDYAIGSKLTFENYVGDKVTIYCLLDRDYHTTEQVKKRQEQALQRGIELHVWGMKELENYLIIPSVICRVMRSRVQQGKRTPSEEEIQKQLDPISEKLKQQVLGGLGTEFENDDHHGGFKSAMLKADTAVRLAWNTHEGRQKMVSGKAVLSDLSKWAQEKYGLSFGTMAISRHTRREEIPAEVARVLTAIEEGNTFQ